MESLEQRHLLAGVVINEIMYHPASENSAEEYVELLNTDADPVDLTGWRFSRGVDLVFPAGTTLDAGAYLVIAADLATFSATYGGGINVVGPWQGSLNNSFEEIELEDALGDRVDRVTYADEGDWAVRRSINSGGVSGWDWLAEHDGRGKSLELIHPELSNRRGQNWAASTVDGGTPGAANTVAASDIAPIIWDVAHSPPVPTSTQQVSVTAKIIDEAGAVNPRVFYRDATSTSPGAFTSVAMIMMPASTQ